jgi:DNA-binding NarL/FixJ family response regulator
MQSLIGTGPGQTRWARPASTLTRRELQVVAAVVDGTNNREIGESLGITEQTVKNHLSNVFDKLGVSNRLELALYAVHRRLLAGETSDRAGTASRAPASKPQPVRRAK